MNRCRLALVSAVATVVAAPLAACGADDAVKSSGAAKSRPTGPGEVVVQVMVAGGLLPPGAALSTVPTLTVLGDGTVIRQGPTTAVYPGPALPPLHTASASAQAVDDLVRKAGELGLLGGSLDYGRPPVADAPDTTVTIAAAGTTHRQTAAALGTLDDAPPGAGTGLSAAQVANRRALKDFLAATERLPDSLEPWRPAAIAVYDLGLYEPDPALAQPPVAWPLGRAPEAGGTATGSFPCSLYQGDDARVLFDTLGRASARTPWVVAGQPRSLAFRPILPGQPACPGA